MHARFRNAQAILLTADISTLGNSYWATWAAPIQQICEEIAVLDCPKYLVFTKTDLRPDISVLVAWEHVRYLFIIRKFRKFYKRCHQAQPWLSLPQELLLKILDYAFPQGGIKHQGPTRQEIDALAAELLAKYEVQPIFTSAKTGLGIEELFQGIATRVIEEDAKYPYISPNPIVALNDSTG